MAESVTINLRHVARGLGTPLRQVEAVCELLDEGNTVPFITRYRKDQTGGLDEEHIRQIQSRLKKMRLLAERKQTILRSIESQGKLTDALGNQIRAAGTAKRLEDLYLPFKPKKQTLATLARSRGLESLAREILEADPACADLDARAADFVNPDRQIPTVADALLGAGHILAEQFSEQAELRQRLREILQRTGKLFSTRVGGEQKDQAVRAVGPDGATDQGLSQNPSPPAPLPASGARGEGCAEGSCLSSEPVDSATPPENHEEPPVEASDTPGCPVEPAAATSPPQPAAVGANEQAEQQSEPGGLPQGEGLAESPPEQTGAAQIEQPAAAEDELPGVPKAVQPAATEAQQLTLVEAEPPVSAPAEPPAPAAAEARPKGRRQEAKAARLNKRELKKQKAEEKRIKAFSDYYDYREEVKKIPPHRVLAINRGERAKVLRVKIESDLEAMHRALDELLVPPEHPHAAYLRGCARDALGRLILPSLEREIRRELTDRAEVHAVGVFARNLRNLLLQPPVRDRRLLAVDPGFKSGCKLAALDQFGNMLEQGVIYLVGPPERRTEARQKVLDLLHRHELSVVVIGNGTACRQCEEFFAELISGELKERGVAYVIVNEAGASVYSISRIGREEFPEYDATLRGTISIGRRLQDPLSELVKIDAASIGVGLYQHDVKAKHLRSSLDEVVESCVNYVGVDVNTASPALLRYVSGLNQLTARRVYEHRREHGPFRSREQLRAVPGFGEATFVQAAGFLKIAGGDQPLDATWIHPESYEAASRVLTSLGCTVADLTAKSEGAALTGRIAGVDLETMAKQLGVGTLTLKDILAQFARPGRDPREDLPLPVFKQGVLKLEDLSPGMELTGTVLNVVDFGAFVDIGMHDSGLVHISQLADRFIRDPHTVVAVGDVVKVWVIEVDKERRRVSLSMVPPGTERPRGPRRDAKSEPSPGRREDSGQRAPRRPKPRDQRGPEPRGRPRSKGAPREKGPPKPSYRPKPPPKPVIPITDEMKTGKEPMRTFGDLAQFFQEQRQQPDGSKRKPSKEAKPEAPAAKGETQAAGPPPPPAGAGAAPQEWSAEAAAPEAATNYETIPDAQPEATTPSQPPSADDLAAGTPDAAQNIREQGEPGV